MAQKRREDTIKTLAIVWPEFDIQVNDLIKPTTVSVIKFFEELLHSLDVNIEQIKLNIIEHMSHPDAYQDLLHNYALFRCTKGILNHLEMIKILMYPFTISDILCPTPKQHGYVAMLISNFLLYTNNLLVYTINPIENRVRDDMQKIEKMHKESDELTVQANIRAVEYSDFEKNLEKVDKEIKETLVEYEEERQTPKDIISENEILKKENSELEAEQEQLMEILRKALAQEKELNHLLVDDYEMITTKYERLEKELTEELSYERDYAVNLAIKNDAEMKYVIFVTIVDEFLEQKPVKSILEIYEPQNSKKKSREELKELQSLRTLQSDLQSTIQKLQEESDSTEEEIQAMQVKMEAKQAILEQEIKLLEEERHISALKQKENNHKSTEINQEIKHNENYCVQYEQTMTKLNNFHQKIYKNILENSGDLHNEVDQQLKDIKSYLEQINFLPVFL